LGKLHQGQIAKAGDVGKDRQPASEHDRMGDQPVFVDEIGGDQRARETGAAMGEDVLAGLRLQPRDLAREFTTDDLGLAPRRRREGAREHRLRDLVHRWRDGLGR
jgi:hypothetical protein